jgi:hypothetical protein
MHIERSRAADGHTDTNGSNMSTHDDHTPASGIEPPFISAPLPIHMGGLMRCCIATWEEIAPPAEQTTEGDTLACSYCSSSMVARDGAWRWNHE